MLFRWGEGGSDEDGANESDEEHVLAEVRAPSSFSAKVGGLSLILFAYKISSKESTNCFCATKIADNSRGYLPRSSHLLSLI